MRAESRTSSEQSRAIARIESNESLGDQDSLNSRISAADLVTHETRSPATLLTYLNDQPATFRWRLTRANLRSTRSVEQALFACVEESVAPFRHCLRVDLNLSGAASMVQPSSITNPTILRRPNGVSAASASWAEFVRLTG